MNESTVNASTLDASIGIRRGSVSIMVALLLVPLTVLTAVMVESGRVWVARTALQNGVEAAAISAASAWMKGGTSCNPAALSLVSVDGSDPESLDCNITGTNRRGTVAVAAAETVGLRLAHLVGRDTAHIDSRIRVRIAPAGTAYSVWPLALCVEYPAVQAWLASGMTSTATWVINFNNNAAGCGGRVPGNWGLLDFNGGNNSTDEAREWVADGYLGSVSIGDLVPGNPGVPSTSIRLKDRVGDSVTFALYDLAQQSGNGATYRIVGFARARIVEAVVTGSPAKAHLSIVFERGTVTGGPGFDDDTDFGVLAWGVCSIESQGDCS